jgi:heme/copper-type cytochrome/quinol oxidase subunit 2
MFKHIFFSYCDAPEPWQIGLQDPATPVMEGMISFHNYLMFFLVTVVVFVLWMLYSAFTSRSNPFLPSRFSHSSVLEITWTVIPALILVLIALPSFTLLYSLDELIDASLTLKIIGHQWY